MERLERSSGVGPARRIEVEFNAMELDQHFVIPMVSRARISYPTQSERSASPLCLRQSPSLLNSECAFIRDSVKGLCEQAATEQDPEKLLKLTAEIDMLLSEKYDPLEGKTSDKPKT